MHTAFRDPRGTTRTLPSSLASRCLVGTGPFVLGFESDDCVSVSAPQQGKCSRFLSKWGSELSLCHPLLLGPSCSAAFPCLPSAVGQFAVALVLLPVFVLALPSPFRAF